MFENSLKTKSSVRSYEANIKDAFGDFDTYSEMRVRLNNIPIANELTIELCKAFLDGVLADELRNVRDVSKEFAVGAIHEDAIYYSLLSRVLDSLRDAMTHVADCIDVNKEEYESKLFVTLLVLRGVYSIISNELLKRDFAAYNNSIKERCEQAGVHPYQAKLFYSSKESSNFIVEYPIEGSVLHGLYEWIDGILERNKNAYSTLKRPDYVLDKYYIYRIIEFLVNNKKLLHDYKCHIDDRHKYLIKFCEASLSIRDARDYNEAIGDLTQNDTYGDVVEFPYGLITKS